MCMIIFIIYYKNKPFYEYKLYLTVSLVSNKIKTLRLN